MSDRGTPANHRIGAPDVRALIAGLREPAADRGGWRDLLLLVPLAFTVPLGAGPYLTAGLHQPRLMAVVMTPVGLAVGVMLFVAGVAWLVLATRARRLRALDLVGWAARAWLLFLAYRMLRWGIGEMRVEFGTSYFISAAVVFLFGATTLFALIAQISNRVPRDSSP